MSHVLESDHLRIAFDEVTGALTGLLNKTTGWQVIRQPKLSAGIRLVIPIPGHRNNRVLSMNQRLASTDVEDNGLVLRWNGLVGDKSGPLDIEVIQTVRLDEDQVRFNLVIDNRSPYLIEEVWSPIFGGMREPRDQTYLTSRSMHMCGGFVNTPLGPSFPQQLGYWGVDVPSFLRTYPESGVLTSFILLDNGTEGLYIGQHDAAQNVVSFLHELHPGYSDSKHSLVPEEDEMDGKPVGYVVSTIRLPFIQPGERMALPEVVVRPFAGDWHEGMQPYIEWRGTWHRHVPLPEWAADIDAWMTLHIHSPEGCARYSYPELVEIAREAKEGGVGALQLIGWARDGQDGAEPYQDPDQRLGTKEELKSAIQEIEALGVRVLLMCKYKWADRTIPEYETEILPHTMKDMFGDPVYFQGYAYQTITQQLGGASRRIGAMLCHQSPDYRQLAVRELNKLLELGSSGMLYDELTSDDRFLCFDPNHQHRYGDNNIKGSTMLAQQFYEACRRANPDFLMAGEGPNDHLSQYYNINYIRTQDGWWFGGNHTAAWKFMDPDMRFATCLTGWDDREMVNQSLAFGYIINYEPYNFKGTLGDIPRTVAYGKKVQALRRKLKEYLWEGVFCDTIGAQVMPNTDGEFVFSIFTSRLTGKRAIVVANQSRQRFSASVSLKAGDKELDLFTAEEKAAVWQNGQLQLQPRSLAVLVES